MAASRSVILDVEAENSTVSADQLVFQDIPHTHSVSSELTDPSAGKGTARKGRGGDGRGWGGNAPGYGQKGEFSIDVEESVEADDSEELLEGRGKKKKKQPEQASFWSFDYYQSFFDVDTRQVLSRIVHSMIPNPRTNYLLTHIRPKPDLYGPFWVCTTLVFCIGVAGNISTYLHDETPGSGGDFHKVTLAATTIFVYWWLMPSVLHGLLSWRGGGNSAAGYLFSELLCIYGYSLSIYIPVSILWIFPSMVLRWTLLFVGMTLSGAVLVITLWPAVKNERRQIAMGCMALVVLLHGLLAVGFLLYFFVPSSGDPFVSAAAASQPLTTANVMNKSIAPSVSRGRGHTR